MVLTLGISLARVAGGWVFADPRPAVLDLAGASVLTIVVLTVVGHRFGLGVLARGAIFFSLLLWGVGAAGLLGVAAVLPLLYGLSPKLGALLVLIPRSIVGAAFLIICGMIAIVGLRLLGCGAKDEVYLLTTAISLMAALTLPLAAADRQEWFAALPPSAKLLLGNGVVIAITLGILLNGVLRAALPARAKLPEGFWNLPEEFGKRPERSRREPERFAACSAHFFYIEAKTLQGGDRMKRSAHLFAPAVVLLLAALALAPTPAAAAPADLSQLFCPVNRSLAQTPPPPSAQGLTPLPEPMASALCGCASDTLCQGHTLGSVCKISAGRIFRCNNPTGQFCTQSGGTRQQCMCEFL